MDPMASDAGFDVGDRSPASSGWEFAWHFEAVEARFLRASFSAFVDLMILTTQIIEESCYSIGMNPGIFELLLPQYLNEDSKPPTPYDPMGGYFTCLDF
ncbi:hypothetical protein C4D60_Mb02t02450 [Musa balbisiana]|uniref:Uncharacterized protein n=1 Tax=Musa balbisiana TaxID=52838 RepID=A0A4S8I8K5_MUSBA|nr:hypothetical protein C4D60_Mb02t02450 [Musa balbisiana]